MNNILTGLLITALLAFISLLLVAMGAMGWYAFDAHEKILRALNNIDLKQNQVDLIAAPIARGEAELRAIAADATMTSTGTVRGHYKNRSGCVEAVPPPAWSLLRIAQALESISGGGPTTTPLQSLLISFAPSDRTTCAAQKAARR